LLLLSGGLVVVDLVQDAAVLRGEGAMVGARRPARIGIGEALLAALALLVVADDEIALDDVDFFPVVVNEGLGGERSGVDPQEPRATAALVRLVEIRREHLLEEPGRIARRALPAVLHVDFDELQV
jgi:hypothetical protein